MLSDTAAIILAAGKGTRMGSAVPKPLVPVLGRPMIDRLLDTVDAVEPREVAVVVGHGASVMRALYGERCRLPFQARLTGTAGAVACARETLAHAPRAFVLVGDSPLLTAASLRRLHQAHIAASAACSFLTATFPCAYPYARVLRGPQGEVADCVEARDATPAQLELREYLTSHFLFESEALLGVLDRIPRHATTGERYLTDALRLLIQAGQRVQAVRVDDWRELVGLNKPRDVAWAEHVLRERGHRSHSARLVALPPMPEVSRPC